MSEIPKVIAYKLGAYSDDVAGLLEENSVLYTTPSEWWEYGQSEDLIADRLTQWAVDKGDVDDLDADWALGNREDWQPTLREWSKLCKSALDAYEKGVSAEEMDEF